MTTTIQKWGNSQGVRLPKVILDDLNLREGEEVEIFAQDNSIVIKTRSKRRKSIEELFANYDGNYKPEEFDWGKDVGREKVW